MPDSEKPRRSFNDGEKDSIRMARELRPLLNLPGWKIYAKILQSHLESKLLEASAIVRSMDEAIEQNAAKGAVLGLRLALGIPSSIIKDADEIIQSVGGDLAEE